MVLIAETGTISGEVTNFSVGDDWTVTLRSTPLSTAWRRGRRRRNVAPVPHFDTSDDPASSSYAARAHVGTMWTMGSGADARSGGNGGNWSGTFYVGDGPRNDGTPDGAAGEFSAQFLNAGVMAGAFGVINVTPDTTP